MTTAALLSACTRPVPLLPESGSAVLNNSTHLVSGNSICNHSFNATQRSFQPIFNEKESNSIVEGSTHAELLRSLRSTSAFQGQGNTKWTVSWSFDLRRNALGCRIADVKTSVDVNYHFPIWSGQLVANNRTLASQWSEYSDALRVHHCKHGKTGIDASLEVGVRLRRLKPISSCETLKREADALARSVISVYKLVESDFTPPNMSDYLKR